MFISIWFQGLLGRTWTLQKTASPWNEIRIDSGCVDIHIVVMKTVFPLEAFGCLMIFSRLSMST